MNSRTRRKITAASVLTGCILVLWQPTAQSATPVASAMPTASPSSMPSSIPAPARSRPLIPIERFDRPAARATRSVPSRRPLRSPHRHVRHHKRYSPPSRPPQAVCGAHWASTMTDGEVWIATRESQMNPNEQNHHSSAYGLGQLLDSTYRDLGLRKSSSPCAQIHAMRAYIRARYGSTANAIRFWRGHRYY